MYYSSCTHTLAHIQRRRMKGVREGANVGKHHYNLTCAVDIILAKDHALISSCLLLDMKA